MTDTAHAGQDATIQAMKLLLGLYSAIHAFMAALFAMAALMLIAIAARVAWTMPSGNVQSSRDASMTGHAGFDAPARTNAPGESGPRLNRAFRAPPASASTG